MAKIFNIFTGSQYVKISEIRLFRYNVESLVFNYPGGSIKIPQERVKYIEIEEDYDRFVFPLMRIDFMVDSSIFYDIMKNKDVGKFHIRIDKFYTKADNTDKKSAGTYIDDTFSIILDNNLDDLMYAKNAAEISDDYRRILLNEANVLEKVKNEVEFYLFRTSTLDNVKGTAANVILSKATVSDAVGYLVAKAGLNNVLFAPPDNRKVYESLIIPPLNTLKALQFLDTYYGLYKCGSVIYFGYKYSYIMPFYGGCKVWYPGQKLKVTVVIPKTEASLTTTVMQGSLEKGDDASWVIADYKTVDSRTDSISNNYISGNDIQIFDPYSGSVSRGSSGAKTKTGSNFAAMTENMTENPFLTSMYTSISSASSMVVKATIIDCDIGVFEPNKEYQVLYEDSAFADTYNGKYEVVGVRHLLIRDGNYFTSSSIVELKKTN